MLAAIKDKAQGWFAWVIVIFISIPFALWGISSYFEAQATVIVAEVNGNEITHKAFLSALERERLRLRDSGQQPDSRQLKTWTLNGLVEQSVLIEATERAGYRISDAQLQAAIQGFEIFQRDGRFAPDLYQRFVLSRGYRNPSALEEEFRNLSIIQQAQDGFVQSAIVTDLEIDRLLTLQGEQRELAYVVISPKRFLEKMVVSDEDVQAFYTDNTSQFRSPEQTRVQYVELTIDDVAAAEDASSEEELRKYYEENIDRYHVEQRRARHILIKPAGSTPEQEKAASDKAQELVKRLRAGEDFGKIAKAESDDSGSAAKGGDLGFIARGVLG
ncbi:MAG: SurA N-terminal domain-containing protein, partial [Pirellulaceae bacterium]